MEVNVDKLRDFANIWNKYTVQKNNLYSQFFVSIILAILVSFIAYLALVPFNDFTSTRVIFGTITGGLGMGVFILNAHRHKKNEEEFKEGIETAGKQSYEVFQSLLERATLSKFYKENYPIEFNEFKATKEKINWTGFIENNVVFLLKRPMEYIYVSELGQFRILKGAKTFTGRFTAKVNINNKNLEITISPKYFNIYLKCLEDSFEGEEEV